MPKTDVFVRTSYMILKEIKATRRTSSCSFLYFCHGYKEWRFFGTWRAFDFTSNNIAVYQT